MFTGERCSIAKYFIRGFQRRQIHVLAVLPSFLPEKICLHLGILLLVDYPLAQVIYNSLFSFAIGFYILCSKPFKDPLFTVVNGLNEISLGILFILTGVFLKDLSDRFIDNLTLSVIFGIIGVILPTCCSIFVGRLKQ